MGSFLGTEKKHPQIEDEHLFYGLLEVDRNVVPFLFNKLDVDIEILKGLNNKSLDKFSKVEKLENINRAIESSLTSSSTKLETKLTILSNIGSVSPYVGLLGTVWGIMNAFRGLSTVGQATLSQVAPGIAEALIATALGLFAAIPAVLAYNVFTNSIEKIISECESFSQDFINYLSKQN